MSDERNSTYPIEQVKPDRPLPTFAEIDALSDELRKVTRERDEARHRYHMLINYIGFAVIILGGVAAAIWGW